MLSLSLSDRNLNRTSPPVVFPVVPMRGKASQWHLSEWHECSPALTTDQFFWGADKNFCGACDLYFSYCYKANTTESFVATKKIVYNADTLVSPLSRTRKYRYLQLSWLCSWLGMFTVVKPARWCQWHFMMILLIIDSAQTKNKQTVVYESQVTSSAQTPWHVWHMCVLGEQRADTL